MSLCGLGHPMYRRAPEKKRVWVTIDYPDGTSAFRLWRGGRVRHIRAAAQAKYPDCKLGFGAWW